MALQLVFKRDYMEYLKQNINVSDYLLDEFPYDKTKCVPLAGIKKPEGLLAKLDPTPDGDLQSAIELFKAYPPTSVTPLFAQQDDLWVYLSHVDLFSYVQKRWDINKKYKLVTEESHISSHWFHNSNNFLRTTFAGFWWHTYLTYDPQREDPFELTKIFFKSGQDFRTLRFGEVALIRSREAMVGILEFLLEHPDLIESNFVARGQYISRYFNKLGAYKQLAYLNRDFFKKELESKLEILQGLRSTDQVQNTVIDLE